MAQVDIDVIQEQDGTVKIAIIHCDGTAGTYKVIPCPCPTTDPGSGQTDPPIYPSTERCAMANGYMFAYIVMLETFWTKAKEQPDNVFGNLVAASQAATQTYNYPVYNIRYSGFLTLYGTDFEAIEFTVPLPGVGVEYDPVLRQELVCMCNTALAAAGDAFNQDWTTSMSSQFLNHASLGSFTPAQWAIMGFLHDTLTLEYWQHYAPQYGLDPVGFDVLPCDDCEEPTSPCDDTELTFDFNTTAEGYTILNGSQGAGYIAGAAIPVEGFPDYDIPGVFESTSRGAYILLALNVLIARVSVTFRYKRFDGTTSGVGHLLYCYDAANNMLFGGPLGGSTTSPQDTDLTFNFDISGVGVCNIHHAVLAVNFGSSKPSVQYIQVLEAHTYLTLE